MGSVLIIMSNAASDPTHPSSTSLARRLLWTFVPISLIPFMAFAALALTFFNRPQQRISPLELQFLLIAFAGLVLLTAGLVWLAARAFGRRFGGQVITVRQSGEIESNETERSSRQPFEGIAALSGAARDPEGLLKASLDLLVRHYECTSGAAYLIGGPSMASPAFAEMAASIGALNFSSDTLITRFSQKRINLDSIPTLDWLIGQAIATRRPQSGEVDGDPKVYEIVLPLLKPAKNGPQLIGMLDFFADGRAENSNSGLFSSPRVAEMQAAANLIALSLVAFSAESAIPEIKNLSAEVGPDSSELDPRRSRSLSLDPSVMISACSSLARAETRSEVLSALRSALHHVPYASAVFFKPENPHSDQYVPLEICRRLNHPGRSPGEALEELPDLNWEELEEFFHLNDRLPLLLYDLDPDRKAARQSDAPSDLFVIPHRLGCSSAAYIPAFRTRNDSSSPILYALLMVGASPVIPAPLFGSETLRPILSLIEDTAIAIDRIDTQRFAKRRLAEFEILSEFTSSISTEIDLNALLRLLHTRIEAVLGPLDSFAVGFYDPSTNRVDIPYLIESGQILDVPAFPLGTGLSSAVIRSREALLLSSAAEVLAASERLGAFQIGEPARSWLGVPMLFGGNVVGLIIVQDTQQEGRFTVEDSQILSALAAQVAVVVRNTSLLEISRRQAQQERLINEITDRIRRAVDMHTILKITADELGRTLGARRAEICLKPPPSNGHLYGHESSNNEGGV